MIQEAIEYVRRLGLEKQTPHVAKHGEVLVLPGGNTLDMGEIADKYAATPRLKKASVTLSEIGSFVAYWRLHERPESVIFGDPHACTFKAIFDYHGAGTDTPAGHRLHSAGFALAITPEWKTWMDNNGKKMPQLTFAEFIEDNTPDIFKPEGTTKPDAAGMLETARELEAKGEMQFVSHVRLSDGRQSFTYNEATNATVGKGYLDVPEDFVIRLVPYVGSATVQVTARLRFRINDGKLVFWYDFLRPHKVREDAFASALTRVEQDAGKPVLIGSNG